MKPAALPALFFLLVLVTSCGPQYVTVIRPGANAQKNTYGEYFMADEKGRIAVQTSMQSFSGYRMTLNITVSNEREDTLVVDPGQFFYMVYTHNQDFSGEVIGAIQPDSMVLVLEEERAEVLGELQALDDERPTFLGSLLGALLSGQETEEEAAAKEKEEAEREALQQELAQRLAHIDRTLPKWRNQVLRKTILPPGYTISGPIEFPRRISAKSYHFSLPLDTLEFQFPFNQDVVVKEY